MSASSSEQSNANPRNAFSAGFLAWTFDAFDFFILTYVLSQVASEFKRPIVDIAFLLTASLMMRPVGAFIFGLLGDHYGRRKPLIANILFYAVVECLSGLAPTYKSLLMLRLLFGIGMGGIWGLGASLAMESVSKERRGIFSGILQEGYALGNLLAAVAFWTVFPHWGWRPMFFLSVVPALLTVVLLMNVRESTEVKGSPPPKTDWADYLHTIALNGKRFLYLILLMTVMNFLSHGTQDLYPTFLQQQIHFGPKLTAIVGVISMLGAIVGGIVAGSISDRQGRRRTMIAAMLFALLLIPIWVFSHGLLLISVGAFLMQFMVQGAWGVIPAHINELVPGKARALLPGFAYQLGVLLASRAPTMEAQATHYFSYGQAMAGTLVVVVLIGVIVIGAGPEARHVTLEREVG
jgi:SHS family lactate transporter-like MFS transporter